MKENLGQFENRMNFHVKARQNYFSFNYKNLAEMTDTLRDMYAFLGVGFEPEDIRKALSKSHSYVAKKAK